MNIKGDDGKLSRDGIFKFTTTFVNINTDDAKLW